MNKNKRGFTLIELLVVIAIIAVLAGIVFPVFSSVKEKGRTAHCSSNLKQLMMGVMMYAQDHDEVYMPLNMQWYDSQGNSRHARWHSFIYPYTKSEKLYLCPTTPEDHQWGKGWTPFPCTYAGNCRVFGELKVDNNSWPWNTPIPQENWTVLIATPEIAKPVDCYALIDAYFWHTKAYLGYPANLSFENPGNPDGPWWGGCAIPIYQRHSGGLNVAYFDGHVEWHNAREFYAPNYDTFVRNEPWTNTGVDQVIFNWD